MTTPTSSPRAASSGSPCGGGRRGHRHTVDAGGTRITGACTEAALWRFLCLTFTRGGEPLLDGRPFVEPRGFSAARWLTEDAQRQAAQR